MKKLLFLILLLGIIVDSCGRNQTEIPTEIVTETPATEAEQTTEEVAQTEITESSQLMDINEITYFDDVFNCTDCRGYLFLAKDMTWYDLSGGSSLFLSYGRYSISNGVVTLSTEYSDSGQYGNRMYNITYKDSELFLIDEDMEYKIDYKANKEEFINIEFSYKAQSLVPFHFAGRNQFCAYYQFQQLSERGNVYVGKQCCRKPVFRNYGHRQLFQSEE